MTEHATEVAHDASSAAPRVSVIVPYLRAEATIERALASVLLQTMGDLEVVTVGDGSTDGTRARIEAMRRDDARIRIVSHADNRGPSFARNRGIAVARGEWIAVLDADDRYAIDRLQTMLDRAGDADVVVDNLMGVDPVDGMDTGVLFPVVPALLTVEHIVAARVTGSSYNFGYLKPLLRRSFIAKYGLCYIESLRTAEDLLFLLRCALVGGPIRTVDKAGYFYNLQISPKTRKRSATSHSLSVDRAVAAALDGLLIERRGGMTESQISAVAQRRDELLRDADVSLFREAMRAGRYGKAVALLVASLRVQAWLSGTVLRKLSGRVTR